jgi:16S rRNA (cytidine1402-2'-O)-methyltransferase
VTQPRGRLWLVPAPLDFGCAEQVPLALVLPDATIARAAALTYWVCENARTARAYLKRVGEIHPLAAPLREQHIVELPREVHKKGDHAVAFDASGLLAPALQGHDMGLLSEAGIPALADPGSSVVRAAHDLGMEVMPLVGPGSIVLALAASGLNGQNFAFVGYVPQEAAARAQRLRELEALVARHSQTQAFIETPYRNVALWKALCETLQAHTRIAVASGLTLPQQRTASATVAQWRQRDCPVTNDVPAVFAIGR